MNVMISGGGRLGFGLPGFCAQSLRITRKHERISRRGFAMRTTIAAGITSGILLASGIQLLAHHSGAAEFDVNSHIELSGVVTKIEWTNPHAHFYIDVKDASGKVANWNLELASPNVLVRNGWSRHSLKEGDQVNVTGLRAKDNSNVGHANTITFPDGRQLSFGSGPGN